MNTSGTKNITDYLYGFAQTSPDKLLLLHPEEISYKTFCKLVDSYACGFLNTGISKGTKTIVLITPGIDLFATIFALFRIGAVPVLIDPGMGNKAMAKALCNINAKAFVGIPKALLFKYIFPKEFHSVRIWISTGLCFIKKGKKLAAFRKRFSREYKVSNNDPNDPVAVFFTSGSTGAAKAVLYKNYMFEAQLNLLRNHFKYQAQEIDLCTFPLLGLFSICLGLSLVLADMDMTHPARLKPEKLVQNIYWFGCTYMFCSPMVLKKLAEFSRRKKLKLPSLKRIMTAGAPVSPQLLHDFAKLLANDAEIHTPYGATEALPVTDISHKELLYLYENSECYSKGICVGYPLINIELRSIKITDAVLEKWEDVEVCKNDEVGEIIVKGQNVSQNYVNNKLANEYSKIKDSESAFLWHRMGDVGRIDAQGRVWFYGRKSQRLETERGTLFTIPTEAVFNQHEDVERSALVGVVEKDRTNPVVCIQLKKGRKKTNRLEDELLDLAKENDLKESISDFFFFKNFPVDPRHNAKIYREKLTQWILKKVK